MIDTTEARALVERLDGYTPGPWRVAPTDDTTVICPERTVVAEIDGDYNEPDLWPVMEGNARLIAAAPDLHAALTAALDENERLREACNQSRLALAGYVSVQSAIDKLDALGDET